MKQTMAMTTNVKRSLAAVRELQDRSLGVEGMGLLWGMPGEGKSTTIAYITNTLDGIFLRANACWTVTSMLGALCIELGLPPLRYKAPMIDAAVKSLMEFPRPVFVDEADYLLRHPDMLDALRDIYDYTGSPVVLIGMETMARKIQSRGRFARRITQWIEFCGIGLADTKTVADTVCEVSVDDALLSHLHTAARANIGRMITGLAAIEKLGTTNKLAHVTLKDWGNRRLFFDQPRFRRGR